MNKEVIIDIENSKDNDLISRQAVFDCFKKWQPYMATRMFEFEKELKALPSVTPQPNKWITCSEMLPEKDGQYICTVKFKHEDGYADEETHAVEYIKAYGGWDMDRFFSDCNPQIIAWMELPEPYKAESEE